MELVVIRTFQNYFTAHILLGKLRQAGVECYLRDEHTVTVGPFLSNSLGGIKLIVKKSDEEEVLMLLQNFDDEYRKTAVCPRCGGNDIILIPKKTTSNFFTVIVSWLFSNLAMSGENVYQCTSCNYESNTLPEPYRNSLLLSEEDLN